MSNEERTYRGPIIEWQVEGGIPRGDGVMSISPAHALAVYSGTGEIVILHRRKKAYYVSVWNDAPRMVGRRWTVTP